MQSGRKESKVGQCDGSALELLNPFVQNGFLEKFLTTRELMWVGEDDCGA